MGITQDGLDRACPWLKKCLMGTHLTSIMTLVNELRTDFSEHQHGGIYSSGTGTTSAGPAIAAAAVVALGSYD